MADSACLMQQQQQQQQPFSYTSAFVNDAMEVNLQPIHALGQSVSFGRFMSESLAWEKWSTFSHNRYVEEAEKYSRPGSVAQKKAFFEAHYKKIAAQKAAALLEQANAASNPVSETKSQEDGCLVVEMSTISSSNDVHEREVEVSSGDDFVVNVSCDSDFKSEVEGGDAAFAQQKVEENLDKMEFKIQIDGVGLSNEFNQTPPQINKFILKSPNRNAERSTTMCKKKAVSSSSKLPLFNRGASKIPPSPAKPTAPSCLNNATPIQVGNKYATPIQVGNKYATECADKRKSTPKSLRMAVNFTPIRELNKLTSTVIRKIERSRVGLSSSKAAKDCPTPLRTPKTALKTEAQKHPSATPWSEKKRNKTYSPFSFTPFSLRTEERAARRKEKLEEKFNKHEPQKAHLQTKLKEKAETEIRKLRQSFCFKARPLPDFYKERKVHKNNEVPMSHPQSPKLGKKTNPNKGEGIISQSGHRPPVKSSNSKIKNLQGKTHSLSLRTVMWTHENTSPNIQQ